MARSTTPGPVSISSHASVVADNDLPPAQPTDKTWFRDLAISSGNWNKLFPYQLLVVNASSTGSYSVRTDQGGTWRYTFPIPPESLSLDLKFAMTPNVTLGGIVEQTNGLRMGSLSLTGTTGVVIGREPAPNVPPLSFAQAVFAGTIQAAGQTLSAAQRTVSGDLSTPNVVAQSEFDDTSGRGKMTGFYQFRLLQYFLEAYAEMKRTPAGRSARLAVATWKDEATYLVTPQVFKLSRAAGQPLEYSYAINFDVWKRVKLSTGSMPTVDPYVPVVRDPNALAKLLNTISDARAVLQGARKTILAIGGDVQHALFEPLREVCLFAKDALSVPLAVADLGDSLIDATRDAILDLKSTRNAISSFPTTLATRTIQVTAHAQEIDDALNDLAAERADDPLVKLSREAHPANTPFENPSGNYDYFSTISVGDLRLSPVVTSAISTERRRCRSLTRLDFESRRDSVASTLATFERSVGADGLGPGTTSNSPTADDYDAIYALNRSIVEIGRLAVTTKNDPQAQVSALSSVAGLASRNGIAFRVPRSKFAVPFPYGATLETLALRYLGDPSRSPEIAALNGLRPPYVDEIGFDMRLLVNGTGNTVVVASDSRIVVGQPAWIASSAVTRSQRRVTRIEPVGSGQILVTLDGDPDLDRYTTLADSVLQAFLPDTTNSQQTIFVPSDVAPDEQDFQTTKIPGVDEFDPLISIAGVDFLLTPANDLVLTDEADVRWAVGLNGAIQQIRIGLSVRKGKLMGHDSFGIDLEPGQSVADLNAADLARSVQGLFATNPTFSGVAATQVDVNGPTTRLNVAVNLAGTNRVIPLSVEARR